MNRYRTLIIDWEPEWKAIINRATLEGFAYPPFEKAIYLNKWIKTMKTDGLWSKTDLLLQFAYNSQDPNNILSQRSNFSDSSWNPGGWTKTSNTTETLAPNGTYTACKIGDHDGAGIMATIKGYIIATSSTLTYSIYVKGGTASSLIFRVRNNSIGVSYTIGYFTTSTGEITGSGWTSTPVGKGWHRVAYTLTGINIGDATSLYFGNATEIAPATDTWYIWGGKVEAGSTVSPFEPDYSNFSLINWKNPSGNLATPHGDIIYTAEGWEGNATNGYIDSGFNPAIDGVNYTLNNAGRNMVIYKSAVATTAQSIVDCADGFINANTFYNNNTSPANQALRINQGSTSNATAIPTGGTGFKGINRDGTTNVRINNGAAETVIDTSSVAVTNANQMILRRSDAFGTSGLSIYTIGAALSSNDIQLMRNRYNDYLTKVGLNAIA